MVPPIQRTKYGRNKKLAENRFNRRRFLQTASLAGVPPASFTQPAERWDSVEAPPAGVNRVWVGPAYWANRLQDWKLADGRIECVNPIDKLRTLAVLTRELRLREGAARLSVQASRLAGRDGFCGFLVGAGGGRLDWRSAALVQQASGEGGGILCVWESDGQLRFREHTDEDHPHACAEIRPSERSGLADQNSEMEIRLTIVTGSAGTMELELATLDRSGRSVSRTVLRGVESRMVEGGILLVSSGEGQAGARYGFRDLRTGGPGVSAHPDRILGPILGTLHSINGSVLKLSAQLCPVGQTDPRSARLEVRDGAGRWRRIAESRIEDGFVVVFRVPGWNSTRDRSYRVSYAGAIREGVIRKNPVNRVLTIGMINCVSPVARNLDGGARQPPLPGSSPLGRYTPESIAFPSFKLVHAMREKRPDLLIFSGDQIYEGRPTRTDPSQAPTLDYLYKWSLWHWAFRDLTRDTPAIVQVDDHDVYQGNIWGQNGRQAPGYDQNRGGYVRQSAWVNMVQRTQCSHNPDPYDSTPIEQNITVYYGSFRFGGASFAILEDRKFKTGAVLDAGFDENKAQLLGRRQEEFLAAWARDRRAPEEVKICLTQTTFACVQTGPDGQPLQDRDSNGYPKEGRDRALKLLSDAGAFILSGDQHLSHVVRHGMTSFSDGPVQFTAPAGASLFARWFEPARELPNAAGPHTGDFTDGFGNRFRVLAVANPGLSFAEYRKYRPGRGQGIEDARLRADGYAVVRVDKKSQEIILESWPAGTNPAHPSDRQFAGWPLRLRLDNNKRA